MKIHSIFFLIPVFALIFACTDTSAKIKDQSVKIRNAFPDQPVNELLDSIKADPDRISILIDKSEFILQLRIDTIVIKTYPVVLGKNPVDDKRMEGDKCTPEGDFELRALFPHKKWSKFLWIDYPNAESWKKFNAAKEAGEIPASATIGGEIGIHGVPGENDALIDGQENWTLGCISLKNKDVDEIYSVVKTGTKVKIQK